MDQTLRVINESVDPCVNFVKYTSCKYGRAREDEPQIPCVVWATEVQTFRMAKGEIRMACDSRKIKSLWGGSVLLHESRVRSPRG